MTDTEKASTRDGKPSRVAEFIADPRWAVWRLSMPVMLGMALYTLYSVTDMIFVGMLGGDAVAALTFNMPTVFFGIGITFGLGTGATAVIARLLGEGDRERADNAAEHALLIAFLVGGTVIAAGLSFKHEIIALLGATGSVGDLAIEYFEISVPGFIFTTLNVSFRSIMTGEGDTRTPLAFAAGGTVLNAILDPVLIFWAGLGISGAAWATMASQILVLVIFVIHILVRKRTYLQLEFGDFSPSKAITVDILRVGVPSSASMIIMSVGGMFTNWIVSIFGSHAVAGLGVGGRLDAVYFLPTLALASSQVTLTGMFLGAGRIDLIRQTMYYTMACGQVMAVGFGVIFWVLAPYICPIFTDEPAIADIAVSYIRVIVFAFPFVTFGVIAGRVFQGLGSGLPGLVLSSLRVLLISVPLAYVFSRVLGYGLTSVWVALALSGVVSSVVALLWIRSRLHKVERTAEHTATAPMS